MVGQKQIPVRAVDHAVAVQVVPRVVDPGPMGCGEGEERRFLDRDIAVILHIARAAVLGEAVWVVVHAFLHFGKGNDDMTPEPPLSRSLRMGQVKYIYKLKIFYIRHATLPDY